MSQWSVSQVWQSQLCQKQQILQSGQTRRSFFLGRLRVCTRSDCCSRAVWEPRSLEISYHCSSSYFVYNFSKTPWFPLMWMIRFVNFVHKDLFPDKYLWSLTWEIHLKILQPTPCETMIIAEVVNKVGAGPKPTNF